MKKVLIMFLLSMAVTANAGLHIMVQLPGWPSILWEEAADSKITIVPSDEIKVGVFTIDDGGQTQPGSLALGLTDGLGSFVEGSVVANTAQGVTAMLADDAVAAAEYGIQNPFVSAEVPGLTNTGQRLVYVVFHCDGPGDVTFVIVDENGEVLDTQVVHQIPEPMTIALMGLGGLAMVMSRKKAA